MHLDAGGGKFETRFLQFEFHRVRVDGRITHILVSVSDVSSRVELARELQNSQSQAQAQVDTLLGILHIDPVQLASFLNDSNAAMKMINAVLREPAREEGAFRKKLDTLFRQAHSVKGEAAALGLSSIESRAHSFEDDLKLLRERPGLSGNDFLPLVIKLDDLLTHLQSVSELVSRLSKFQVPQTEIAFAPAPAPPAARRSRARRCSAAADGGLQTGLEQLTARVAAESGKQADLALLGPGHGTRGVSADRQGHRNPSRTQCHRPWHRSSGGAAVGGKAVGRGGAAGIQGVGRGRLQTQRRGRRTRPGARTHQGGGAPKRLHHRRSRRRTSTRSRRSRCCFGPGSRRSRMPPRTRVAASV